MSHDAPIVVFTSCQDVAEFVARFAPRVSLAGIRVPSAMPHPPGAPVRFEVRLADGSAALRGDGAVMDLRDRGREVAAPLRYELTVGRLRFDARNEVVYERILMLRESEGEPGTGEVSLHDVEQAAEDRGYEAPPMPPSRPPPAPTSARVGSAPPPRGSAPPLTAGRAVPAIPAPRAGGPGAPPPSPSSPLPGGSRDPSGPGPVRPGSAVPAPRSPAAPGGLPRPAIAAPALPPRPGGPPRPAAIGAARFSPVAVARPASVRPAQPSPASPAPRSSSQPRAVEAPAPPSPSAPALPPVLAAAPPPPSPPPAPVLPTDPGSLPTPPDPLDTSMEDVDGPTSSHALPVEQDAAVRRSSPLPSDVPPAPARVPAYPPLIGDLLAPRIVERKDTADDLAPMAPDMTATTPGMVLDGPTSGAGLPRFAARTGPSGTLAGGTSPGAPGAADTEHGVSLPGGRPIAVADATMDGATRQLSLDEAEALVRATRPRARVGVPVADDDEEEHTHGDGLDGPTMRHDVRQLPADPPAGDDE